MAPSCRRLPSARDLPRLPSSAPHAGAGAGHRVRYLVEQHLVYLVVPHISGEVARR
jgi:hypothetical protein